MSHPNDRDTIEVVIAEDHELVREGIKTMISVMEGIAVVGEARDGCELLGLLDARTPHVVLTDISMPRMDGLAALADIHARWPGLPVLVLSMYDTVDFVKRAVQVGACGYVMKNASPRELEQAIRAAARAGTFFSPDVSRLLMQRDPEDVLTERQVEILRLVADGLSSKEIAYELGLSPKTVDVHRARIMERLRLNDIASLTRYAVRKGLVKA